MYSEFATFSNFSVKKVFVRNEPIFFFKAPKFWTSWRFLLVQLHFSASLPHLAIFKKNPQIFRKTHLLFLNKKPKFFKFLRNFITSVAFYSKLAAVGVFWKTQDFFWKTNFFQKGSQVSNVLWCLTNSVAFYCIFATFGNFLGK